MLSVDKTNPVASTPASGAASTAPSTSGSRFAETLRSVQHRGRDLDPIFAKASATYGVPQELLRAIAFHESGFETDAVSHAGAMGLMQLMPVAAQAMGVSDPFDPEQNVMGGAKLLGQYLEKYDGNLKLTLAAYGAGCGSVAKYNGIPPYKETQNFVADIMSVVHAGGLPAWDHAGTPTVAFASATMPAATSTSAAPAAKTTVTPRAATATVVSASSMPAAVAVSMNTKTSPAPISATLPTANTTAVSPSATRPLATTTATSATATLPSANTTAVSPSATRPLATTTATSATAMRIFTRVTPAAAIVSSLLGATTPASATISAAEIAAQNLATLLAHNTLTDEHKTPAPADLPTDSPTTAASDDAFRTALVRGLSNIGTGNMSSLQTAFFAQQPSSAAITELFQQIEAFDDFTEEDYRLLVTSLLVDMNKKPSETDSIPPFYLGT